MTAANADVELLLRIARCPIVEQCLTSSAGIHPCAEIVLSQSTPKDEHQVPEPWSGRLARAPILFVSSNPSISIAADYPKASWSNDAIVDFFENRFGGGRKPWVRDGVYSLCQDGTHAEKGTAFWRAVRNRAAELLEIPVREVTPGEDYALTEVVHCKSRGEQGVAAAQTCCANKYLDDVVGASAARVVVCLGSVAAGAIRSAFAIPTTASVHGPVSVGLRSRWFAFLPHPAAWVRAGEKKTFAGRLPPHELRALRSALRA